MLGRFSHIMTRHGQGETDGLVLNFHAIYCSPMDDTSLMVSTWYIKSTLPTFADMSLVSLSMHVAATPSPTKRYFALSCPNQCFVYPQLIPSPLS